MNSLTLTVSKSKPVVYEKRDRPTTDSLKVAEYFGKRHSDVLRDIEALECSKEFTERNFALSCYKDESGKKNKMHTMTFDGFMFLAMGYRGKKAAALKEAYINEFNSMATFIRQLETAKAEFHELADAIKFAHGEEYHAYHFSNEFDLINRIVFGVSTKKLKKARGIPESADSIRPYLTDRELKEVIRLQRFDAGLIVTTPDYRHRKQILQEYHDRIRALPVGRLA